MKGLGLAVILTFALMCAWLNASHLVDALVRIQPGLPPVLTNAGLALLPKGSASPIVAPIFGLLFSAAVGFCLAFRNLVVTERPWVRMGMFLLIIGGVLACWWVFKLKLGFVNPADASDPEIARITQAGLLSLKIDFVRGSQPIEVGFIWLLVVYTFMVGILAYPESKPDSPGHGVRGSLRR